MLFRAKFEMFVKYGKIFRKTRYRLFVGHLVVDSQPTANVNDIDNYHTPVQSLLYFIDTVTKHLKRIHIDNLRADMKM